MRPELKRSVTTQYVFLFIFQIFTYLLFSFVLDLVDLNTKEEKLHPGIDLKEFR